MAKQILKYPLQIVEEQELELPFGAKILSVINQRENVVLYAMSDVEEKRRKKVVISLVCTGAETDIDGRFVGTISMENGFLMLHIFYRDIGADDMERLIA